MRDDWIECTLGEICDLKNGFAFKSKDYVEQSNTINFRMSQIRPGGTVNLKHNPKFLPDKYPEIYSDYLLKTGDIVIAMTDMASDTKILGVPTIIENTKRSLLQNQRVGKLVFLNKNNINIPYLRFILTSPQVYSYYKKLGKGGVQINLGKKDILNASFPLAPLPEQRVIVAQIEKLFSSLDNGISDLNKASGQLKIYRQAVLKKAFTGELSKEWRAKQTSLPTAHELLQQIQTERQNWLEDEILKGNSEAKRISNKLKKNPIRISSAKLPESWSWANLINSCLFIVDCHNKTAPYIDDGIYLVRTTNIRNGKLDLNNKIKFVSEDTYNFWSKRAFPTSGDIIFTREAPMGEATIIPPNPKICLGQRTMLFRTIKHCLDNKYLLFNILSEVFQQRFKGDAIGTGVKHLRVGDVENLSFPICSHPEQLQIVQEIESRLSVCDNIEQTISASLAKAEGLRQSILKKAFAGELLSSTALEACRNDPDWQPASELLKQIKAKVRE